MGGECTDCVLEGFNFDLLFGELPGFDVLLGILCVVFQDSESERQVTRDDPHFCIVPASPLVHIPLCFHERERERGSTHAHAGEACRTCTRATESKLECGWSKSCKC